MTIHTEFHRQAGQTTEDRARERGERGNHGQRQEQQEVEATERQRQQLQPIVKERGRLRGGAGADRGGAEDGGGAEAEHPLQRAHQAQAGGGRREHEDGLQHRWVGIDGNLCEFFARFANS